LLARVRGTFGQTDQGVTCADGAFSFSDVQAWLGRHEVWEPREPGHSKAENLMFLLHQRTWAFLAREWESVLGPHHTHSTQPLSPSSSARARLHHSADQPACQRDSTGAECVRGAQMPSCSKLGWRAAGWDSAAPSAGTREGGGKHDQQGGSRSPSMPGDT
jgi:hypothetical protein